MTRYQCLDARSVNTPMAGELPIFKRNPETFSCDDRRVITRLMIPGGDPARIVSVIRKVLEIDEAQAKANLAEVMRGFDWRHRDVTSVFEAHYQQVAEHVDQEAVVSETHRRLIGAYFTMEYSIESAALFNPSIVQHADQNGLVAGSCRFIMSLRATGEGHISSIVFRTGVIDASCNITFDPLTRYVASAKPDSDAVRDKHTFFLKLIEMGAYNEIAGNVLDRLPEHFVFADLRRTIDELRPRFDDQTVFDEAAESLLWLVRSNYHLKFPADCPISEVVIFPVTEDESRGIEDARFVRFTEEDGSVMYYGTYTAYNGFRILPQLLQTPDFTTFKIMTMNGKCVQNKGMALFPRKINGKYMMISRLDGENLHIMASSNVRFWNEARKLRVPVHPWEFVQIGNCGSPIETEKGWLLLTHGVGPMRRYCIGADLLDRDDPSRIIASSKDPIFCPNETEREGYVPNVVYSCGAMVHGDQLVMPYGMSDSATGFATVSIDDLLSYLLS